MHSHLQQAQTLNLHIVAHFPLFLWSSRLSQRHHNWDKSRSKFYIFTRCLHGALFSTFFRIWSRKWRFSDPTWIPKQGSSKSVFRTFWALGTLGAIKCHPSLPQEPPGANLRWFLSDFWQIWGGFLWFFCNCCLLFLILLVSFFDLSGFWLLKSLIHYQLFNAITLPSKVWQHSHAHPSICQESPRTPTRGAWQQRNHNTQLQGPLASFWSIALMMSSIWCTTLVCLVAGNSNSVAFQHYSVNDPWICM